MNTRVSAAKAGEVDCASMACPSRSRRVPLLASPLVVAACLGVALQAPPSVASAPWDVAAPPGEGWSWSAAPIDVEEGTWLSLDVSPDGSTIVFDLLGDIYTLPIAGGQVTCIASGLQWDMQPVFSPDGQWIAFVSDRTGHGGKGGDNIWVMRTDGSEPRQITRESFRLLTQPCWLPDGSGIVARKHFTSRRSLGAGEMWLYHPSGTTDGMQLTNRPSEQKDVGEPAMSPCGRYLYYSLDASPGQNFEYDKDSNAGIYAIDRLDLQRGETIRLIAGPGGACRPTPSPDGKQLAFVRRVRYQTTLFVMDLESGLARPVHEALERDNQETWAIHGVYPRMAWTPDSASLVFWAGGKIRRVDVATGEHRVIPFRVQDTRQVAEALRVPIAVAPEYFPVRMLRDVQVSPKGDRVVYQALGHLYTAELAPGPDGMPVVRAAPRRLTTATDEFEFFPSWSRDGRSIVYVAWNDDRLGAVKIVAADGGEGRAITVEPGHYADPVFTPDGARVVYGKQSGGYLTSPLWSRETGVFVAPAANAQAGDKDKVRPRLLTRRGTNPQFGFDGDRVYLTVREGGKDSDNTQLVSVPLDGAAIGVPGEERTHLRSDWATEFRVAPDGRHAAFVERFKVYATPLVAAGRPVEIGPGARNVPVVLLGESAGSSIHWSGDGSRLHWSLGPELFTANVAAAMRAFGAPKEKAAADASADDGAVAEEASPAKPESALLAGPPGRVNISFEARQDVPRRPDGSPHALALVNARLLTMQDAERDGRTVRGGRIIDDGVVVVVGNRIEAVGAAGEVVVPAGAERVDLGGATVMPGLIDVHAHGSQGERGLTPQRNWINWASVAFGTTTIHDPSNDTEMVFAAAELARIGQIVAPRIFSTGTILYGASGSMHAEVQSLEDALFHLERMKAVGAFSVKSYNQPRRDQRQMVLEAARRLGMMVVPEGGALFQHNLTMVVDGHTSVEHTLPVENIYDDVCQLWRSSRTGYTPTLGVAYGGLGGENYWYARTNVWENEHLLRFVPRFVIDPRARRRMDAPDGDWNHIKAAGIAARLLRCGAMTDGVLDGPGGGPTIGAHGQLAGLAAHWEMWMLVQGGFTPFEALRAATLDGAWYVGLDGDIGSLAPGKLADLIVLERNPLEDIRNSTSLAKVMLNGRLYESRTMRELSPVPGDPPKFFFEALQSGLAVTRSLQALHELARGCVGCGREGCCPPGAGDEGSHAHDGYGYR